VFGAALLGALLLVVAELTTLYVVRTSDSHAVLKSVGTGPHHSYGLIPVAVLSVILGWGVWRPGSRPALLAIGVLGVLSLLISLIGDLPDAHGSGLIETSGNHFAQAGSSASTGLYMETLGAVVLIVTSVSGFLLIGSGSQQPRCG
jgi:hypothetical protein